MLTNTTFDFINILVNFEININKISKCHRRVVHYNFMLINVVNKF